MKIIKLGGSVITNKDKYRTANIPVIKSISKIISEYLETLVIVHGAGSFGHVKAVEFGLDAPGKIRGKELEICTVIDDVLSLNSIVSHALIEEGVRAVSLPTHALYGNNGMYFDIVKEVIGNNLLPILYGDIIMHHSSYRIISGDEIMLDIARNIKAEEIIFITDVDGIYTSDPKLYSNAKLIRDIKASDLNIKDKGKDATGSMSGKVENIKLMLQYTHRVKVINGMFPERLRKALNNEDVIGTVIH